MTPQDDDLAKLEADDALLSAVAANADAGDDPAGRLLAEIAETARGLTPRDAPGGGGRRVPRRRGGLWGVSLGVSIVVAAGGGLSAAATDRLPAPVQQFVVDVGQGVPPASAQVIATPTEAPPPSAPEAERTTPQGGSGAQTPDATDEPSPSRASAAAAAPGTAPEQWWSDWSAERRLWYPSYSTSSSLTGTPQPTPTGYPASPSTAPTGDPDSGGYPAPTPYPQPTSTPAPVSEPAPTSSPQPERTSHGHPSPSPSPQRHTSSPKPQPTHPPASPSASHRGD
ncbi:hypothetical protein [Gryllotalpicola koreensis]|uniref:Uncharacterized protein n=1 Tax=Gryllotalpicola koreensis TaxID=993086 RepID=A0ABP7ZY00_9MICO